MKSSVKAAVTGAALAVVVIGFDSGCGGSGRVMRRLLCEYKDAALVLDDGRESSASRLQERGEFSLDEALLLEGIAHVTERRPHVERAAHLALVENIVAAQVN